MKKKMNVIGFLSAVVMLTLASGSCSRSETGMTQPAARVIRLEAGLAASARLAPSSKAPVNTGSNFTAAVAGWENAATADYSVAKAWAATAQITATQTAEAIALSLQPYYNQNSAVKTYIRAWYPAGTLSDDGKVTFAGSADFSGNGTDDVLVAAEIAGSAADAGAKTLTFSHPLTQLVFKLEGDAAFSTSGVTIRSIKVREAALPGGLDLSKSGGEVVMYDAAGLLTVPGIAATQTITTTATAAGDPVMMRPFTGNICKIDVETSADTYSDVTVKIDGDANFVPGKAYTISLRFSSSSINVSATVTPWAEGTGSGTVQ